VKLNLSDEKGKTRAIMAVTREGPWLDLFDEKGKVRAMLNLDDKIGPGLGLFDEKGKIRVSLRSAKDRLGLRLYDKNGTRRVMLGADMNIVLNGKKTIYPESSLLLYGSNDKLVWEAP